MRMGDRRQTYAGAGCAQAGGSVVVWKLDRLGRNTLHILATVKLLTERGVTLVSTTGRDRLLHGSRPHGHRRARQHG